jgi:hypothetical protein
MIVIDNMQQIIAVIKECTEFEGRVFTSYPQKKTEQDKVPFAVVKMISHVTDGYDGEGEQAAYLTYSADVYGASASRSRSAANVLK